MRQILLLLCIWPLWAWAQDTPPSAPKEGEASDGTTSVPQRLPASTPRGSFPKHINNRLQLLADGTDTESARWLEAENERFLAMWYADRSGEGKGALLIVHAEGELPYWPKTTSPLHNTLPDYGWATLAISLPSAYKKPVPQRTFPVKAHINDEPTAGSEQNKTAQSSSPSPENTEPPQQTTNTEKQSTASIENITEERMTAALKFLHDRGQFNVALMGSGVGAIRAHRFMKNITPQVEDKQLKEQLEKPIRALIVYNARNNMPTDTEHYKDWFFDPEIPFLDIYTTIDKRNQRDVKKRNIMAKKKKADYQRVRISEMSNEVAWGENRLSRRIRSFLDATVKGVEIDNAIVK